MKQALFAVILVAGMFSVGMSPDSWAGHKHHKHNRSNKGGKVRGKARAKQVQEENINADQNRGFQTAPGLNQPASAPADSH